MTEVNNTYRGQDGTEYRVVDAAVDPVTDRPRCWLETGDGTRCSVDRRDLIGAVADGVWDPVDK